MNIKTSLLKNLTALLVTGTLSLPLYAESSSSILNTDKTDGIQLQKTLISPHRKDSSLMCTFTIYVTNSTGARQGNTMKASSIIKTLSVDASALHQYLCPSCKANKEYTLVTHGVDCTDNAFHNVNSFSTTLPNFINNGSNSFTLRQVFKFNSTFDDFTVLNPKTGVINFKTD